MNNKNKYKSAFTLVELSIVLVIIGLIVASVTAGRSLIRAAQIRSLVTFINTLETGINSFNDRYNAIPGDFAGAATVFTGVTAGDGNGIISNTTGTTDMSATNVNKDPYLFFSHLAAAGLIDGSYTGLAGSLPRTKFRNLAVTPYYASGVSAGGAAEPGIWGRAGHVLVFAATLDAGSLLATGAAIATVGMTANDVFEIDTKIDDGIATAGKVYAIGFKGTGTPCGPYNAASGVAYTGILANTSLGCGMAYWLSSI